MKTPLIFGLIVLSTLTLASCTNTPVSTTTTPPPVTPINPPSKTETTTPTMIHGTSSITKDEEHHMGASSEEEFIVNMIPHHGEAVDAAKIIVAKTENAELKKIAQAIVDGQSKEIIILNGWLKSWYPNSTLKTEWAQMMRDLSNLSAHDLDDSFMEDMIKHHE